MTILKISLPGATGHPGFGKPWSLEESLEGSLAGEGPPSWQQQAGCKPHPAADVLHRQSFRALHSGDFFTYLTQMGEGFASASQSLSEPLAQRQDASFRQRRLDLGTAGPPGHDETAFPSVKKPCARVLVYNHPVQPAQQRRLALYQLPLMG